MENLIRNGYDEEKRDGYVVETKMKKIWSVQLDLLMELQRVCNRYNIKMFVVWGTLLGAIRHKGFIPWDDDLDVGLLREDYDKLCEIASKEFCEPYFFQTADSDRNFFIGYARLRNSDTTGIIKDNLDVEYNNGIYIDIYPLDGYPQNNLKRKIQFLMRDFYTSIGLIYYRTNYPDNVIKKGLIKCCQKIAHIVKYETILKKYYKWCTISNKNAETVGLLYHNSLCEKYYFKKRYIGNIKKMQYENCMVNIPENYDKILKSVYGDYMKFPPVKERGMWHNDQLIYDPDIPYKEYIATHNINE